MIQPWSRLSRVLSIVTHFWQVQLSCSNLSLCSSIAPVVSSLAATKHPCSNVLHSNAKWAIELLQQFCCTSHHRLHPQSSGTEKLEPSKIPVTQLSDSQFLHLHPIFLSSWRCAKQTDLSSPQHQKKKSSGIPF